MSWHRLTFARGGYHLPPGCPDPRKYPHRWTDIPERGALVATQAPITGPNDATLRTLWYANHGDATIHTVPGLAVPWRDAWAWSEIVAAASRIITLHRASQRPG